MWEGKKEILEIVHDPLSWAVFYKAILAEAWWNEKRCGVVEKH